jgi:endonuclease YncB( thermonuclease family)
VRIAVAIVLALAPWLALADFTGRVVRIVEGDTLDILVSETPIRVRLEAIDAPERGQAFGKRSQQSLARICAGKGARVAQRGKDCYGRPIGIVTCDTVEANREQVRLGMAWVYVKYASTGSPLYGVQHEAKIERRGLWADADPVAPWKWRYRKRQRLSH